MPFQPRPWATYAPNCQPFQIPPRQMGSAPTPSLICAQRRRAMPRSAIDDGDDRRLEQTDGFRAVTHRHVLRVLVVVQDHLVHVAAEPECL